MKGTGEKGRSGREEREWIRGKINGEGRRRVEKGREKWEEIEGEGRKEDRDME